jgi:class 3 adenylate cyclase
VALAPTQYARSGDVDIAYQVIGDGPHDVVLAFDWGSHLETLAELPAIEDFVGGLARFSRVLWFDMRGIGMSSPVAGGIAPMETWIDDLVAVMDAAGSERAAVVAQGYAAQMAIMAATTRPDLVSGLVLVNGFPRLAWAPDYRSGIPERVQPALLEQIDDLWGTGALAELSFPSASRQPGFVEWWGRVERYGATPRVAVARMETVLQLDVRHLLPLVDVPTLVVHARDNQLVRLDHGRYLADHISGARLLEVDSTDHFMELDAAATEAIEELVTGSRSGATDHDRVLATVLFVDVVGSTDHAQGVGDERWRRLLDRFEKASRDEIARFGGSLNNTMGDGVVATFDGPARAIRCACRIRDAVRRFGLDVRSGLHAGEVTRRGADVAGIAVHIGARVADAARPGEVLVTRTVRDLVAGSGVTFVDRGEHELKGVPEQWALYAAAS